ncbi:sensor histidine kinase [Phenylobacterium sp.]|uniref:sensor histidine kinase n=1 Tax=Phenylobacterium sp. TaxID=1871053 RepID=UPI0025DEFCC9|nr:sensor histidine kinase [Phenylobacterium sp.]
MADDSGPVPEDPGLERRYRALFANMAEGFVVCEAIRDDAGRLVDYWVRAANPVFVRRAPAGARMVGRRQSEIRPSTAAAWFGACARALACRDVRFEYRDTYAERWYDVHMMRLSDTEFGQFFIDVSERKAAEARQAELFDELNHRVKNNLSVVSAILELQARSSPPGVRAQLSKAVDRIRTIADLHSMLYRQNSRDRVDLQPYLEGLCARLGESLFEEGRTRVAVSCAAVAAPVRDAVSLGLIVNELVTNAAKHAFAGGRGGQVTVTLSAEGARLRLAVADDGPGQAGGGTRDGGLGLRMVRSLAAGLGGEVRFGGGPGTRVDISLPMPGT